MFTHINAYIKNAIEPHIEKNFLTDKPHIICGLSGGPDSVFLLYFLRSLYKENKIILTAAHLDHGWRTNSHIDATFCKELCKKLSIPYQASHVKNLSINYKYNGSQEEIGRKLRRHFFQTMKQALNADYVALAHHQQDQQETFFLRLIRGSSLDGLTGIKPVQSFYIRPLLQISKEKILQFLHENNISYQIDPTNSSDDFLRNRIRSYILPAIKQTDSRFSKKFESTLANLSEENQLLHTITKETYTTIFTKKNNGFIGKKEPFLEICPSLQKRILILWLCNEKIPFTPSNGFLQEIIRFISGDHGGNHEITPGYLVTKRQKEFWLQKAS